MKNQNGQISVVIVNYNAGEKLANCIASAINQVDEIIVVDNASRDNSISIVTSVFPNNPKLLIIRNRANLGFGKACNIGYQACSGASVLFLNPDCVLSNDTLKTLNHCLHENAMCGMVGGLILNEDGSEQAGGRRDAPTPWNSLVRAFKLSWLSNRYPLIFPDYNLHKRPVSDQPAEIDAISGSCMLVKREAIENVGIFDEGYFMHVEDLDWCIRFRQNGWKILFVPDAKVMHHRGVCSRSRPIFVEWHKHKGMIRYYNKFLRYQYPRILSALVYSAIWLRFVVVAYYYALRQVSCRNCD